MRVFRGSQIPRVGFRARWAMPVLARLETRSNIAVPVLWGQVSYVGGVYGLRKEKRYRFTFQSLYLR